MFGFLFKVLIIAGLVAGGGWYLMNKKDVTLKNVDTSKVLGAFTQQANKIDVVDLGKQASQALDSLVSGNSPVVLGVEVSNQTIGVVTDTLMKLPNDQLNQIRKVVCEPAPR